MSQSKEKERGEPLPSIGTYLRVWGAIAVLITLSYVIFLLELEPLWLRRFLFTAIALTQAILAVSYFMQLRMERPSLVYAVVLPLLLLMALIVFALGEGSYVFGVREAQQLTTPLAEKPSERPSPKPQDLVELGKQLAQANGCLACHSTTGERLVGPTWKGLYGSPRELQDGTLVTADEGYLHESIVSPNAKIVKGFPAVMPPFAHLSEEQIQAIIAFIKSLSQESSKGE